MISKNLQTASLVLCTLVYLLIGAAVFEAIESAHEKSEKRRLAEEEEYFRYRYNISDEDFQSLADIIVSSVPYKGNGQWHFSGAFYFVTTVITTIGLAFLSLFLSYDNSKLIKDNRNLRQIEIESGGRTQPFLWVRVSIRSHGHCDRATWQRGTPLTRYRRMEKVSASIVHPACITY
jgi:hypothetical protein